MGKKITIKVSDEKLRWAKYPLPSEAIKTKTFLKEKKRLMRTTDHSEAWCHEKAIDKARRVLKIRRMASLLPKTKSRARK